ncbi:hypothetical protein GALMADRAFT_273612 [Galerina marginata CBS 339.88]|uniref:Uncharacterized protein n=1 Tax=Galerina marginata (strain CBS 339.88) TaxID=685588 RepID=A0A067SF11_GALM3|nr:hypothetical protein GALMADRAFT_273612 [Galerina marginata CBS 339.88]
MGLPHCLKRDEDPRVPPRAVGALEAARFQAARRERGAAVPFPDLAADPREVGVLPDARAGVPGRRGDPVGHIRRVCGDKVANRCKDV